MNMKRIIMAVTLVIGVVSCIFADTPTLSISNVTFRQRYPWNGLVDIDCDVTCSDPTTNISLYVSAKDSAANKSLAVRSVWLESDATHTNALEVKSGTHRIVWDAGKDNPNFVGDAVTVEVQALLGVDHYLVIDISDGPNVASYPISYLGAEPQGGWTDEYKTTKLVLRRISAGEFIMGSPETELGHDFGGDGFECQHRVTLTKPFYMGVFEVTRKQYELIMGSAPSYQYLGDLRPMTWFSYDILRGSNLGSHWPADNKVDSDSFMGRMRERTGLVFDLPTEAQWEYACRAGTTSALHNGKEITDFVTCSNVAEIARYGCWSSVQGGNYNDDSYGGLTVVGLYLPNAWGLYDMSGNAMEWCRDWWSDSLTDAVDPVGPSDGTYRVIRSSTGFGLRDYDCTAPTCRSAYRTYKHYQYTYPSRADDPWGFRIMCDAKP